MGSLRALLLIVLVVAVLAFPLPGAAHEDDVYAFTGSGWGHSIGMSQYGAFGQALEGKSYEEILRYYYQNISLETIDDLLGDGDIAPDHPLIVDDDPVWVGIRQSIIEISIAPVGGPFNACQEIDGSPICVDLGWSVDGTPETWKITEITQEGIVGCVIERVQPAPAQGDLPPLGFGSCVLDISWGDVGQAGRVTLDGDLCDDPASGLGRECFARGTLHLRGEGVATGFHVLVELGIEDYMYGLGEMPSSWPNEALQAQAVAGRSFLLRRILDREDPSLATSTDPGLTGGRKASCWCHLYSTSRDQNYTAYAKEAETIGTTNFGALWAAAVYATVGAVITHPTSTLGTVALALYHSSSGGHTESTTAVWGTSAIEYLEPVPDPWSNDPAVGNPFSAWTTTATSGEIAGQLGWDEVTHVTLINAAPGGQFEFRGVSSGDAIVATRSAGWLYAAIGSRSPHFIGVTVDRFEPFLDMSGTSHSEAILAIWEAGITTGCGAELYCPKVSVTRAQMASFLARALDLAPKAEGPFGDLEGAGVHAGAINAIAEVGITIGCMSDAYCPDDPVTRAQMATFLARALELEPLASGPFDDLDSIGSHRLYINAIAKAGVTLGCGDGRYCPLAEVTRAQMASFLARAFIWTV